LRGKRRLVENVPLSDGPALADRVMLHPICTAKRTSSCNMVFLLLSAAIAMIFVAIPGVRHRIAFGGLTRSEIFREDFSIARVRAEQSETASPSKPFLIVVLPDGTIVTPRVVN
jgi:hypothetical protein